MPTERMTSSTVIKAVSQLEAKIDNLSSDVKEIKSKLYGNGNPGIIIDQERQNASLDKLLAIAKQNADNINKLQDETSTKFLAKNWSRLLTFAILFFLLLHSILPADMSIWTILMKFLGQ